MKKMNLRKILSITLSTALTLVLLSGCGSSKTAGNTLPEATDKAIGTVLLSVNPEIEVEYNDKGLVLEIEGVNDDGKSVVSKTDEYKGKDCRTVLEELVKEIYEAGYFDKTMDGHTKNIVLKLEKGSAYPDDDFLEDVTTGIHEAIKDCGIGSSPMTVLEDDLDDNGRIGQEKAKELVLAQLGLTSASFNNHEYELDDNVYEFEFTANGVEYEYEVDALTGKILKADFEGNDDWDDLDDWNDWEDFDDDIDDVHDDTDDDTDDVHDDIDDDIDDVHDDIDDDIDDIYDDIDDDTDDVYDDMNHRPDDSDDNNNPDDYDDDSDDDQDDYDDDQDDDDDDQDDDDDDSDD